RRGEGRRRLRAVRRPALAGEGGGDAHRGLAPVSGPPAAEGGGRRPAGRRRAGRARRLAGRAAARGRPRADAGGRPPRVPLAVGGGDADGARRGPGLRAPRRRLRPRRDGDDGGRGGRPPRPARRPRRPRRRRPRPHGRRPAARPPPRRRPPVLRGALHGRAQPRPPPPDLPRRLRRTLRRDRPRRRPRRLNRPDVLALVSPAPAPGSVLAPPFPESREVLGVRVHAATYASAARLVLAWAEAGESRAVYATGAHGLVEAQDDPAFRRVLDGADLNVPDGLPLVWALRRLAAPAAERVYGPDLTLHVCRAAAEAGVPVALYGWSEETLALLRQRLPALAPGLRIVEGISPPFRALTAEEDAA